jgi:hypothetical protein
VTLYEAVVGRRAFPDGDRGAALPQDRFPQLVHHYDPLPERVPRELREVVEAALASEPAERPSAAEVADAVGPLLRRPRRLVLNSLKPR